MDELVESKVQLSPGGGKWTALDEVDGHKRVDESETRGQDSAMGLGEQHGYASPEWGELIAMCAGYTADQALAAEPAQIEGRLTAGVGLIPQAAHQVHQLAVGEAGQQVAEVDERREECHNPRVAESKRLGRGGRRESLTAGSRG